MKGLDQQAEDNSAHYRRALDEGWLPIREVARQTGVNAVTLRAWERRYGLIVPLRTPKGHRLYSQDQVQEILTILTWLNRGVAVSQVKHLLDSAPSASTPAENDWQRLRQTLGLAISQLAERKVDDTLNQAMALYPPRTLCEHLLMPLLAELEQRWQGQFGSQMEQVFFYSWLRSKLGARIYHNNRQLQAPPLLLVNQSDLALEPHLWLTAWLASSADCPVEVFDWPLPGAELALAVERLQARGLLLYSSKALNPAQLPRLLNGISCEKFIAGPAVCIHPAEWSVCLSEIADLHLAQDPITACQALLERGLF
ncbi:helix-turn-helix-type transcriptional regulator [Pseudomonas sp. TKO26]|uniref:MerR family transcriptional regulator n=1 Tax=unclassified Pseudomonas TaxID=196821 RepID=UPI000D97F4DA|nr:MULTISPECIES: MerR family transcriptional regulator [unclassified Pseudomonas]PYY92058.1 helix-turn-helix-type transcriptional regulator [Pseudomonas sp. TKO30]PYY94421.1 helix-turn-helix-type transcriptional regulator [Pseudomonas sp. TKO29]PYY96294.1 helix-turn-helix-type transcriptional regulator [Pseudomonas sp. TKO26]PYZ01886.1 helix-turn-helix-type transcriptional regulator [Pseudomonas sp. TKO14]